MKVAFVVLALGLVALAPKARASMRPMWGLRADVANSDLIAVVQIGPIVYASEPDSDIAFARVERVIKTDVMPAKQMRVGNGVLIEEGPSSARFSGVIRFPAQLKPGRALVFLQRRGVTWRALRVQSIENGYVFGITSLARHIREIEREMDVPQFQLPLLVSRPSRREW